MYIFNPEDFGFEPVIDFPELSHQYGSATYIKVIAIGSGAYWYKYAYKISVDERWVIGSSVYNIVEKEKSSTDNQVYSGLISNYEFAESLLKHLFGTTVNKSVETKGVERLKQNINDKRLIIE